MHSKMPHRRLNDYERGETVAKSTVAQIIDVTSQIARLDRKGKEQVFRWLNKELGPQKPAEITKANTDTTTKYEGEQIP